MTRTRRIFAAAALLFLNLPSTGFGEYGFVWANNPTASSYVPNLSYQHNSTGAINSITRVRTGVYRVLMPNLQPRPYGNVQVTAYGYSSLFCNVGAWKRTGVADLTMDVFCFDTLANPVDSRFTALYHDKAPPPNGENLAYGFTDRLLTTFFESYSGTPRYSHNSEASDPSEAVRFLRFLEGSYRVDFPGWEALRQAPSGLWETAPGNLQLTTVDSNPNRCIVMDQIDPTLGDVVPTIIVFVDCYSPIGAPVDTRFAVAYSRDRVFGTPQTIGAYVNVAEWGFLGSVPASYVDSSFNSISLSRPSISYAGEGLYRVDIPGLARAYGKSTVLVTATIDDHFYTEVWETTFCKVGGWATVGADVRVSVQCYSYTGLPRPSGFSLNFVTDASY